MTARKTIAVVLDTTSPERAAEAVRAAVGLTLRGDRVELSVSERADDALAAATDRAVERGLATLVALGHAVHRRQVPEALAAAAGKADVTEVWT